MLWYKAWIETRSRFLASLVGMTIILVFYVHHGEYLLSPGTKRSTYVLLYYGHHILMGLWMLSVVLLGMGGLIRERALGASSFTLALPVSRSRLVSVQVAVGVLESILLAVFPWSAILLTTDLNGRPFPISQAVFYLLLLISGGLIYFALAVLTSSLIEGEYTAPAVAYGLTIMSGLIFANVNSLRYYVDLWGFMGGNKYFSRNTSLLIGPFPWFGVLVSLCTTALLLLASVAVIRRREF